MSSASLAQAATLMGFKRSYFKDSGAQTAVTGMVGMALVFAGVFLNRNEPQRAEHAFEQ
jgi:hypothetical protein